MSNEILRELQSQLPGELPIIPVSDGVVIFPYMPPVPPFAPHHVAISGADVATAVDSAMVHGPRTLCVFHRKKEAQEKLTENLTIDDLCKVGSLIHIIKYKKDGDNVMFLAHGRARVSITEITQQRPFLRAKIELIDDTYHGNMDIEMEALTRSLVDTFSELTSLSPRYQEELGIISENIDEPDRVSDYIASVTNINSEDKQKILEAIDVPTRIRLLLPMLSKELDIAKIETKIQSDAQSEISDLQREHFLREQLKAIQRELGDTDDMSVELEEIKEKIKELEMPEKALRAAEREVKRLSQMQSFAPEATVSRNYLDWLIHLPWNSSTEDQLDIAQALKILDEDHHGLEKIKDRILEFLAVRALKADAKGPILCFVGPPGVGKTSLGKSIARAMGRKFVRISLGGMRDESEIRGHRKTYIGSMPGRIINGLRQAESQNPVFMLDEVDKLGSDFRGDPASALLEVLDPQQNNTFVDRYLEVPFDLSNVMFIATANQIHPIPHALQDRMETIQLTGYTQKEKIVISKKYLIPRQLEANGISDENLQFTDEVLVKTIDNYTREAGLRNLEREFGTVCRKVARKVAEGEREQIVATDQLLEDYLGPVKFYSEVAERSGEVGVATGMSVTAYGGEILFIETTQMYGSGKLILTGQIGDVMQESAQAALSYIKSKSKELKFDPELFSKSDFHIHVPAGAIPKDGPSAGITIATALFSLATQKKISPEVAMTGEISLRGRVLPIGGLKEKVLAAKQAGIKRVIAPKKNEKDLVDIPKDTQNGLDFLFVNHIDQVLDGAILK